MVFDASVVQVLPMVADGTQPEFADRVFDLFLGSISRLLADIEAASSRSDVVALEGLLHTLKSSSASVGALALSEQARQFEGALHAGSEPAAVWTAVLRRSCEDFAQALLRYRVAAAEKKGGRSGCTG